MLLPFRSVLALTLSSSSRFATRRFATTQHTPPGTWGAPIFPNVSFSENNSSNNIPRDDPQAVYVVTGASRGIGKQFCETFLQDYQGTIVACCRNPTRDLPFSSDRILPLALDLANPNSIQQAGDELRVQLQGRPVHVLLNVAGILHDETHMPERALSQIQPDWFLQTMQVNVLGPILWTQQVLPLMQQATTTTTTPRIIANLSARVGSITDNQLGGWYSYRMSKSALNQFTRTTALELGRTRRNQAPVYCVSLHPGTTKTDLSQPFQRNVKPESLFAPEYTVEQLLQVLQHMEAKHSGGLYDYAGHAISF